MPYHCPPLSIAHRTEGSVQPRDVPLQPFLRTCCRCAATLDAGQTLSEADTVRCNTHRDHLIQ
jgi:hypothetical protein